MTRDELVHEVHKLIWSDRGGNEMHPCSWKDTLEDDLYGYEYLAEKIVDYVLDHKPDNANQNIEGYCNVCCVCHKPIKGWFHAQGAICSEDCGIERDRLIYQWKESHDV
jgi:hypothetical protein